MRKMTFPHPLPWRYVLAFSGTVAYVVVDSWFINNQS